MSIEKILIVDDELLIRKFLAETLKRKSFDVSVAENVTEAKKALKSQTFDLVISDMNMPDGTGIEVLKYSKKIAPQTIVVIITAYGSIENTVEAMKLGAFNYLIKPFTPDTVEAVIEKAKEHSSLLEENSYLREEAKQSRCRTSHQVIAESAVMKKVLEDVKRVAKSQASIFINGESGTGKEVIAHAIHHYSLRANKPFIRVNCAAVPDTLVESEFFGHEKGAFTGANNKRVGRFELADHGTLLLDEVTEIPMNLQPKLLRLIQEQEFERVGGSKSIKVDVRLIATSNRNMEEAIEDKVFREDLYYRLNVVPIDLPPLRERREDIVPLSQYFLERLCQENHKKIKQLSDSAKKRLLDYHWPGNIRELTNVIERAVVMDFSDIVEADDLYINQQKSFQKTATQEVLTPPPIQDLPVGSTLHELEKRMIIETLKLHDNNRTKTADTLGISVRTLRNKINEYESSS